MCSGHEQQNSQLFTESLLILLLILILALSTIMNFPAVSFHIIKLSLCCTFAEAHLPRVTMPFLTNFDQSITAADVVETSAPTSGQSQNRADPEERGEEVGLLP